MAIFYNLDLGQDPRLNPDNDDNNDCIIIIINQVCSHGSWMRDMNLTNTIFQNIYILYLYFYSKWMDE